MYGHASADPNPWAACAAYAYLLAGCAIPVFCMAMVTNAASYIVERLLIGCSLAAFVVCQFWSSIMFSPMVVGMANAIAGGWGNAGARAPCPALPLPSGPATPHAQDACCMHALPAQLLSCKALLLCLQPLSLQHV